ncbi:alpha/beta fold hydrolase [Paenibacillus sp. HWE-109]|uniref:alpha/beta hydrolase n=1 Tax=Paenibacillus sp. HWE-109 TaxID=1306526 RepID=UPI001EDF4EAB|nr:alpha/beta fold hydrolase [Paenibacillus sp. HWE-109]UKS26960.1 alpha/beta fold hydrolase [Paenibacillus sp. HWE-109]
MNTYPEDFKTYTARDGAQLPYRFFEGPPDVVLIFLHGITEPSLYLRELGQYVSQLGLATVYLPDLRGYGNHPIRRGDIDYIGQLDDDMEDLFCFVQNQHPGARIIVGGHSAGGATALRQTIRPIHKDIFAYLLISPALSPNAPLDRKGGSGNESRVSIPRYLLLMLLNLLGIRRYNHAIIYRRLTPIEKLHGTESCNLSYRLTLSRMVGNNYEHYLSQLTQPTFVMIGADDEVFDANAYKPLYERFCKAEVHIIADHNHDSIVKTEHALSIMGNWLRSMHGGGQAK